MPTNSLENIIGTLKALLHTFENKYFSPCSALSHFITVLAQNVKCIHWKVFSVHIIMHTNNLKGIIATRNALSIVWSS